MVEMAETDKTCLGSSGRRTCGRRREGGAEHGEESTCRQLTAGMVFSGGRLAVTTTCRSRRSCSRRPTGCVAASSRPSTSTSSLVSSSSSTGPVRRATDSSLRSLACRPSRHTGRPPAPAPASGPRERSSGRTRAGRPVRKPLLLAQRACALGQVREAAVPPPDGGHRAQVLVVGERVLVPGLARGAIGNKFVVKRKVGERSNRLRKVTVRSTARAMIGCQPRRI
jgi:hypothetical protein